MRYRIFILLMMAVLQSHAQTNFEVVQRYLFKGDYKKALPMYKELYREFPSNYTFFSGLLTCYKKTEQYAQALKLALNHTKIYKQHIGPVSVELGNIYGMMGESAKAASHYRSALDVVAKDPFMGYSVGKTFYENQLLDYALEAYQLAMQGNKKLDFSLRIAFLYEEKGDIDKMFETYMDLIARNPHSSHVVSAKTYIGKHIGDNAMDKNNRLLKKLLLKKAQKQPHKVWNELLSWLFIRQKEYDKAFIQEKALYRRNRNVRSIIDLGIAALQHEDYKVSKSCFDFALEHAANRRDLFTAHLYLLDIAIKTQSTEKERTDIVTSFLSLFKKYGRTNMTAPLLIKYAHFLAFVMQKPREALDFLSESLQNLNGISLWRAKLQLADILVFVGDYNRALIYYTQVERKLGNHPLAQQAQLKAAKTAYYKGDFKWALTQLNDLKESTSLLTANDAMDLSLLISDGSVEDSTQRALKLFANAEVCAYKHRYQQAIGFLEDILRDHKGEALEIHALMKLASFFELTKQYKKAEETYLKVIAIDANGIYADRACYYVAELYLNKFRDIEKAAQMYQKTIFEYPTSIFLDEARKKYRKLRNENHGE